MASAVNDLFLVVAEGTCFGQRIMLTHHYAITAQTVGASDTVATTALLDAMRGGGGGDQWETLYRACLPPEYSLDRWRVQKVTPVRVQYQTVNRGAAGTHLDSTLQANLAATISFRGLLAGRANVGTKHIGPLPDGAAVTAGGLLTGAYKVKLEALAAGMEAQIALPIGGIVVNPVIRHPLPAGSWTLIANHLIGVTTNTMRRRTVGRGI